MSVEAMKQALEALEDARLYNYALKHKETDGLISALRLAIEQAERQEPVGYFTINDYDKWEQIDGTSGKPLYEAPQVTPQVTPQPHREWVGLTDEEMREVYGKDLKYKDGDYARYARAIETKLKEKNT